MDLRTENKYMMFLIKVMFDKLLDYRRQIDELKAKVKIANDSKPDWITVKGNHIPVGEGENKQDVAKEFVESKEGKQNIFGKSFEEYSGNPEQAIKHLMQVKTGYVPNAIYRQGVGDIDFVYGEDGITGYGLAHIVEKHGVKILDEIPNIIKNGILDSRHEELGRMYIFSKNKKLVIRLDWNKEKRNWLTTAFEIVEEK